MEKQLFSNYESETLIRLLKDAQVPVDSNQQKDVEYLRNLALQSFCDPSQPRYNQKNIKKKVVAAKKRYVAQSGKLLVLLEYMTTAKNNFKNKKLEFYAKDTQEYKYLEIYHDDDLVQLCKETQQTNCSLMFIGGSRVGKSTLINIAVQQDLLPTNITGATGAIMELEYSKNPCFSTLNSDRNSKWVQQQVNFDVYPEKPSEALNLFFANDLHDRAFLRGRIGYHLPLLASGITIHDTAGLDDRDELTEAVIQNINVCQAFVCVLNQNLTNGSRRILKEFINLGRSPASILFVITHMENYSTHEKEECIHRLRVDLNSISSNFGQSKIIIVNPRRAFYIFSVKLDRLFRFDEMIRHKLSSIIDTCKRQEERQLTLTHEKHAFMLTCSELIEHLFTQASEDINRELQTAEFDDYFQTFVSTIPFKENIGQHFEFRPQYNGKLELKELDLYRCYLQEQFEICIKRKLAPVLHNLASTAINELGDLFCKHVFLSPDETSNFIIQFKSIYMEHMLKYYQNILVNLFKRSRKRLIRRNENFSSYIYIETPVTACSTYTEISDPNSQRLTEGYRWQNFCRRPAQEFCRELKRHNRSTNIQQQRPDVKYIENCTVEIMNILEPLYTGTNQSIDETAQQYNEAVSLLSWCNCNEKDTIRPLHSSFNKILISQINCWSLSADMIHSIRNIDDPSNDDTTRIYAGEFCDPNTCTTITVYIWHLTGEFCAQHVCNQTSSLRNFRHPNILNCYGAYKDDNNVYVVTERWQRSLATALQDNENFHLEQRVQIAAELTEMCIQNETMISVEQMTLDKLRISMDGHIKVHVLTHRPPLLSQNNRDLDGSKKHAQICHALGIIFTELFDYDQNKSTAVQSLLSLAKYCQPQIESSHDQIVSLNEILYTLKIHQINLQYSGLATHNIIGQRRKRYGLISIDGGGSRGIIAAKILEHLENSIGRPLYHVFDYGAGVSTGGLLVLSTLIRRTPSQKLVRMYQQLCSKIFSPRTTPLSTYSSRALEQAIGQHFGQTKMKLSSNNAPRAFVVTKKNFDPEPYLLRNYNIPDGVTTFKGESGWLCSEAARATTAAQTFFSPFIRNGIHYTDGAMGFNNPTLLLFLEVLGLLRKSQDVNEAIGKFIPNIEYIVSIGTGKMDDLPPPSGSPKTGIKRVFETVKLSVELITNFENVHNEMEMLAKVLGNIPYFRFSPELPERYPLDIRTKAELDILLDITTDYLNDHGKRVPEEIERFKALVNNRTV